MELPAKKWERRAAAYQWLDIIDNYCVREKILAVMSTRCIFNATGNGYEKRFDTQEVKLYPVGTVDALAFEQRNGKIGVLNFSDYLSFGGWFLRGSRAQEECLCHESVLYRALESVYDEYYVPHINCDGYHGNDAILTEDCTFYPNKNLQNPIKGSVLSMAAPNLKKIDDQSRVNEVTAERMDIIYRMFTSMNCDIIILGAWGCGAFGGNCIFVANQWKMLCEKYYGMYKKIIFAVPPGLNYTTFRNIFPTA